MSKKLWIIIIVVALAATLYYLISPVFRVVEKEEASPLADTASVPVIEDKLDTMSTEEMGAFKAEVEAMKDEVMEKKESQVTGARLLASADFVPRAHEVSGRALLIEENGKKTVRFENFDTINGPDLRIWLGAELNSNDIIDLGPIRATKGSVNYELPAGTDTTKYNKVMVWCRAFGVLFSYAELK